MIAIAYFSGSGAITTCAELIAEAARKTGEEVRLIAVTDLSDEDWETISAADAIVFGTPTYMGGPAAGFNGNGATRSPGPSPRASTPAATSSPRFRPSTSSRCSTG